MPQANDLNVGVPETYFEVVLPFYMRENADAARTQIVKRTGYKNIELREVAV